MKQRLLTESELEEIEHRKNPEDISRLIGHIEELERRFWKVRKNVIEAAITEMSE